MENQTNFGDQNTHQIGQNAMSQPTMVEERPRMNFMIISIVLTSLIILIYSLALSPSLFEPCGGELCGLGFFFLPFEVSFAYFLLSLIMDVESAWRKEKKLKIISLLMSIPFFPLTFSTLGNIETASKYAGADYLKYTIFGIIFFGIIFSLIFKMITNDSIRKWNFYLALVEVLVMVPMLFYSLALRSLK